MSIKCFRACLHGGGGAQIGEVTCGGSPHHSCRRDQIKSEIIWTGGLPHLPGVPHLHVNRPLTDSSNTNRTWNVLDGQVKFTQ